MSDTAAVPDKRHVAPITPIVETLTLLPGLIVLVLVMSGQLASQSGAGTLAVIALVLVILVLVIAYKFLAYRRFAYWFDTDGDLRVQSGVLFHQERRLQLSRLQTVDINRPLVARVFGYAAVRVEVAGAGDSKVDLKYVTSTDADTLRSEILARSAGLEHDVGEAPEKPLVTVPTKDLAVSLLLRSVTIFLLLATVLLLVSTVILNGWTGLFTVFLGGVPLLIVASEFAQMYGFTIAESPDGLRLRHGLLQTQARTIPPGRVCAVEFVEPLFWRPKGWVRLVVTVAGVGKADDDTGTESILLPVAPKAVAEELFARVMPGADPQAVPMISPVAAVRRRSPIQAQFIAGGTDARCAVAKRGRFTRRTTVVDHARVQSVRMTRGPWEKALGLASVHMDLPPGRIRATWLHFGAEQARDLARDELEHMRHARASDKSTRWMRD